MEHCSLLGAPSNARMVGKGSLAGTSRTASCTEQRSYLEGIDPPALTPITHTSRSIPSTSAARIAPFEGEARTLPISAEQASPRASYVYIVSCNPDGSSRFSGPPRQRPGVQADTGLRRQLPDHGSASPAGFDTQRGDGKGGLDGKPAYVEWEFVDNGTGGENDSARLRIRLPLCEPDPDEAGRLPEDAAPSPAGPCPTGPPKYFELDHTVFSGSGAPEQFPGSNSNRRASIPQCLSRFPLQALRAPAKPEIEQRQPRRFRGRWSASALPATSASARIESSGPPPRGRDRG